MRPIIIEGCDNSGKTTLANALIRELDPYGLYFKSPGSRFQDWKPEYDSWVNDILTNIHEPFTPVFDRVPEIGELVYGYFYRGQSRLDGTINQYRQWAGHVRQPIIVICRWQGITKEEEHTVTGETIDAGSLKYLDNLYGMMARLFGSSRMSVVEHFPTGIGTVQDTVNMIKEAW